MIINPQTKNITNNNVNEKLFLNDGHLAILKSIIYSNIFDYPLTYDELYHFVMEKKLTKDQFNSLLFKDLIPTYITTTNNFFTLVNREKIIQKRKSKMGFSEEKWKQAYTMSYILSHFPFIRMICVTGSLIFNNLKNKDDDIDFFIVIERNHLWKTRLFIYTFVRFMALFNIEICPNYIISDRNLELNDRNFYSARELKQMIPIYGQEVFENIIYANKWVDDYYPNAKNWKQGKFKLITHKRSLIKNFLERILSMRFFSIVETFEMNRQIKRLQKISTNNSENIFTPDCAKSHIDGHGNWIKQKFTDSLTNITEFKANNQ